MTSRERQEMLNAGYKEYARKTRNLNAWDPADPNYYTVKKVWAKTLEEAQEKLVINGHTSTPYEERNK